MVGLLSSIYSGLLMYTTCQLIPDMGGVTTFKFRTRADNVWLLAGIFVMLLWPWVFLSTVWALGGVQMGERVVKVVRAYPQGTSFCLTLLGNIVSIIISIMFSTAVVRFAPEWATNNNHVTVFEVSLISAFRNQTWPWDIKDHRYLLVRDRWLPVVLAGACIAAFTLVPPGTTSLITPVSFNRTWPLIGTELDFSSNASDCVDWFAAHPLPNLCSWRVSRFPLNVCLANHTYVSEFQ